MHETGVELQQITDLDIFERIACMKYEKTTDSIKALRDEIAALSSDQFAIVTV